MCNILNNEIFYHYLLEFMNKVRKNRKILLNLFEPKYPIMDSSIKKRVELYGYPFWGSNSLFSGEHFLFQVILKFFVAKIKSTIT